NCTQVTQFILTGFMESPGTQVLLFLVFLLTYLLTVLGWLIRTTPQLHPPMYYFLANLAFVDLCSSTTVTPKMLVDSILEKVLGHGGCMAQVFLFDLFGMTESFLLATMAYDHYVAICHPLLYPHAMSPQRCRQLVAGSYLMGLTNGLAQVLGIFSLSFCGSAALDLFFCDISHLISLSTSDTTLSHTILSALAALLGGSSSLLVLLSYSAIVCTVLKVPLARGQCKAFSTYSSHLTTVTIFYLISFSMYLKPSSRSSREDNWAVVNYALVTPMLNPFTYSLRNKEVKEVLRRLMRK
ncbi:OR5G3 protein, partial [Eubucco bourcierii]|nr:OR5G3 protein [Eubucco bourcierii]